MICDDCTMKEVCKYKDTCSEFENGINTIGKTAEGKPHEIFSATVQCRHKQIVKPTPRPQLTPGTWEKKDYPYKPMDIRCENKEHRDPPDGGFYG